MKELRDFFDAKRYSPTRGSVFPQLEISPSVLLAAYVNGVVPLPAEQYGNEIAWFSPDPRGIIPLDGLKVSRSLRKSASHYTTTVDMAFDDVIDACANPVREGGWITNAFRETYHELHQNGYAHSIETWNGDELVGGLFGVSIGGLFSGDSMFFHQRDASKVALIRLVQELQTNSTELLDVQWATPHLKSLGAIEISRNSYLERLRQAVEQPQQMFSQHSEPSAHQFSAPNGRVRDAAPLL